MIDHKLLSLAVRNVSHRGKRTWLTIIGVFIGIAAVVALVSLGQGLEQTVISEFEDLGTDNLYIMGGEYPFGFMSISLEDRDVEVVERAQGIRQAGGMYYAMQKTAEFQDEEETIAVIGIPTDETQEMILEANNLHIETGRDIRQTDINNVVVGSTLQSSTFDRELDIRSQLNVEGDQFRVVGILEPSGDPEYDNAVIADLDRAREIDDADDELTMINAQIQPGLEPEEVSVEVEREMRRDRGQAPGDEDFTVLTGGEAIESFQNILGTVQAVVVGLAAISLLVGAVGIMNTMYMSVTERIKEIGVMKAVGATNNQIRNLFLLESGLIGLVGGIIGIILGVMISEAGAYAITYFAEIPFNTYYSSTLVIGTLVFSFLIGALSGYLPSKKAYELQPVEALRHE